MTVTNTACKAVKQIASRQMFAPYFRSRWQNMQNIVNDSVFMSMIPEPYLTYYNAYIRQWMQWARGFVPTLHRSDFFSTGIGYTICDIMTRECMSGGYRFSSKDKELQAFVEQWAAEDFNNVMNKMFFMTNAGGNSLLSLTPVNGELCLGIMPIDRAIFSIGRNGKVSTARLFNRFTAGETTAWGRETRMMLDGRGYYRVDLSPTSTQAVNPTWGIERLKTVPDKFKAAWEYAYGNIQPSVWYELPEEFDSLGLYNVRNKSVASAIMDMPGYSDSTLHTTEDILYAIDYDYTMSQMDEYWGRTRVLIPKQMQTRKVNVSGIPVSRGGDFYEEINAPQLGDDVYDQIPSNTIDGNEIKPTFIQPDIRGEQHEIIYDRYLKMLAPKIGLSTATLSNHLAFNRTKTAAQVHEEEDTTEKTVNNKRSLANKAINAMLKDVARYYGYQSDAEIVWNVPGTNSVTENRELREDYAANVLPLKEFIKRRYRDLSEEDVDKWVAELEEDNVRKQAKLFDESVGDSATREMFGSV